MKSWTLLTAVSALLLAACTLLAWSGRTPNSDLFMALSSGRDVVDGKLGKPDDWSYLTSGRVWINQSWLSGWALYRVWQWGGDNALQGLRTAAVAAFAAGILFYLRGRGVSWPAALVASSAALLTCRYYLLLRPNLLTMCGVPWLLWLLQRHSRGSAHGAWLVAVALGIWAHGHGGFLLGWALVLGWLLLLAASAVAGGGRPAAFRAAALAAALGAAVVSAFVFSPFGARLVRQTVMMSGRTEWRTVREWWPLINSWGELREELEQSWSEVGYFLALLVAVALLIPAAAMVNRARRHDATSETGRGNSPARGSMSPAAASTKRQGVEAMPLGWRRFFDTAFSIGTVAMAILGRRFISLAVVGLALPLAWSLDALWGLRRERDGESSESGATHPPAWAVPATAVLCILAIAAIYPAVYLGFNRDHPFYPSQGIHARQIEVSDLPIEATRFLRVNGIGGPILHSYNAEGFLHWNAPALKVGCGGRAQQVYTERDLLTLRGLLDGEHRSPAEMHQRELKLAEHGVALLLLPASTRWETILAYMGSESRWVPIYFDGEDCVLVNPRDDYVRLQIAMMNQTTAVVDPAQDADGSKADVEVAAGKLVFPNDAIRLRSRAMFLVSPRLVGDPNLPPDQQAGFAQYLFNLRKEAILAAQESEATGFLYDMLSMLWQTRPNRPEMRLYLEGELVRLQGLTGGRYRTTELLRCRTFVLTILAQEYRRAGDERRAAEYEQQAGATGEQVRAMATWWQF